MGIHDQDTDVFPEEQINIDPLVLEFLDANSYEQRLNILTSLRNRITDEMINTMAVAVDLEIKEGDVEDRYEELRNCLLTFEKYECNRLRQGLHVIILSNPGRIVGNKREQRVGR